MKKNYLKPTVVVYKVHLKIQPLMMSATEQPVSEIKTDPEIKGSGNGFWQSPEVSDIIDDEEDEW